MLAASNIDTGGGGWGGGCYNNLGAQCKRHQSPESSTGAASGPWGSRTRRGAGKGRAVAPEVTHLLDTVSDCLHISQCGRTASSQ